MTVAAVTQAKREWRARLLARRAAMDPSQVSAAGAAIALAARALCEGAGTVAAYLSMPTEPATDLLVAALRDAGTSVLLPVVDGDRLEWVVDAGRRRSGPFGIPEPEGPRLGPAAVLAVDVVLVPALAVDRRGVRLGRGRGYYDRALSERATGGTAPARVVAVVYYDEVVGVLPAEDHDVRMDGVLTPGGFRPLPDAAGQ